MSTPGKPLSISKHNILVFLVSVVVLTVFMSTPVMAGTRYMSDSPNLSDSISGKNEFTHGTTIPLKLQLQNNGHNDLKFVQSGIVDLDDVPNTFKRVTVSLQSGTSPVLIKSDPQMIGDIKGSQTVPASFEIRVPDDTKAGNYLLPAIINYTYLGNAEQEGTDSNLFWVNPVVKVVILLAIIGAGYYIDNNRRQKPVR
jgi:hypothetical protein